MAPNKIPTNDKPSSERLKPYIPSKTIGNDSNHTYNSPYIRAMYKLRRKTIGSVKFSVMGRTSAIIAMSREVMPSAWISGSHFRLSLPVRTRNLLARRSMKFLNLEIKSNQL